MKIIGIIPARYKSTRFEGKPIADICGKPMIWWIYKQLIQVKEITDVYIATDDKRISDVCEIYDMNYVMTKDNHPTHLDRLAEVAQKIDADFYININGDEPLMKSSYIKPLIPRDIDPSSFYVSNAMMYIDNPVEVVDTARIKITTDTFGYGMYMSRTPIPYPKASYNYKYKKFVGIQCFTKSALEFCGYTKRGSIENIEDIDEYRFLENGKKIQFILTDAKTISVDTPKDLEIVRKIIKQKIDIGELSNE